MSTWWYNDHMRSNSYCDISIPIMTVLKYWYDILYFVVIIIKCQETVIGCKALKYAIIYKNKKYVFPKSQDTYNRYK